MSPEVLASFFALAGDARLAHLGGDEVSPHDLRARIEAAGRANCTGIGLGDRDLEFWRSRYPPSTVRDMLVDAGLVTVELEMLYDWAARGEERKQSDRGRARLLEWAHALGASHIKVGPDLSGTVAEGQLTDELALLGREADEVGTRIALETMAVARLHDPADAVAIAERTDQANVGILLDIWHVARAGIAYGSLATLPRDRIVGVELSDGSLTPANGDLVSDGVDYRRPPGDGAFDAVAFVRAVLATGYSGPFGVEVLSELNRHSPLDVAARVNLGAAHAVLRDAMIMHNV